MVKATWGLKMQSRWILIDWGTSSFRAWLVESSTGNILDEVKNGLGMAALSRSEFPGYCLCQIGSWRSEFSHPIYMAGMVGAGDGWQLAPHLSLPLGLEKLAEQIVAVEGLEQAWIIPGARIEGERPDIMRGEEVQVFGALSLTEREDALLCLPGTHSKWVRVEAGILENFTTSMTGEVYDLMLKHSLSGRSESSGELSNSAFDSGLAEETMPSGILHHLFTARPRALYAGLRLDEIPSYLSGVLIGHEIAAMQDLYPPDGQDLLLVSTATLRMPYERALRRSGYQPLWVDARLASLRGVGLVINYSWKT
jgi:2-dehydro-3-deoxygalactonokinase